MRFIAFLIILCACTPEKQTIVLKEICEPELYQPVSTERIVAFGDAAGSGYNLTSCPVSYAHYVAAAYGKTLLNKAIDGTTTEQQLPAVLETNILETDIVVFVAGWNDQLLYGIDPLGVQLYSDRFMQMLFHLAPAKMILIGDGLQVLPVGYKDKNFNQGSDKAALFYSKLTNYLVKKSGLKNVVVVPTMNALDHNPVYYTRDQIHPNKMGQAVLAGLFLKYLKE